MTFDEFRIKAQETAAALGIGEYEMYYMEDDSQSVSAMEGEIQEFSSDVTGGVTFRCKVNGKMGYCSTEQLSAEEAERIVKAAAENAAAIETEEESFIFAGSPHYEATDASCTEPAPVGEMTDLALSLYRAALAADSRVQPSSSAEVSQGRTTIRLINSAGLDLSRTGSLQIAFQSAIVREGTEQYDSYEPAEGPFGEVDVQKTAGTAVQKALDQIAGEPVPSGNYPVVFENTCFANLLMAFSGVFSAKNAQQGLSLLTGKEGEKIASDIVTLTDDPFLPGHQAAFDGEGVATARKNVIENGVFKTLLYNLQTAKKAGRETTGNASRASYYAPVDIAPFNFYVQPGSATAEEIWKTAASEGTALLITELAGLHAGLNPITGDFSLMAGGYRLEDGKKTSWVNGITVSGNFYELLKKISAVGSDLKFGFPMGTTRIGSPSVYCGLMPIAGK